MSKHGEVYFFKDCHRILKPKGRIGIIHWRSDTATPRGPELSIRPKPEQIVEWIDKLKFDIEIPPLILEPFQFGLVVAKK